ncbi:MAG TPA: glycosyltransferase [Tepidisphaeraceae bacterium]|jgi:cellulose synthase/poly-beta-1,6-N-acetylglucosamine synthase-like glycosyltransferase
MSPAISPTVSVLIPSWRRPDELSVCLAALCQQTVPATQVVVAVRDDDDVTHAHLEQLERSQSVPGGFQKVTVGKVPLTASMNAGLAVTTGDLVALTDDDAEPRADWLERCAATLAAHPDVGGVGGRDWQPHERWDERRVGTVSWFGRVVGNHHLGAGPARDVDLLKGVNACFRGELVRRIGFDLRLRGRGNVTHWELSLCLGVRRAGWRLVYDPSIAVDHRPAVRHDGDVNARGGFDEGSFIDSVHNETLALLEYLRPWQRVAFLTWAAMIGTGSTPGLAQLVRAVVRGKTAHLPARWHATVKGRTDGFQTFHRGEQAL